MANYLVTGGCGFIGSHLVERLLKAGHGVRILDNLSTGKRTNVPASCDVVVGDVADESAVNSAMEGMDGCFHLAAVASVQKSVEQWVETHRSNLTGTINVFNAARHTRMPVVYASSAAVYGDNADMPLNEHATLRPLTAYGADKLGSELHGRVAAVVHGVPNTGLRFFNVYGPRQDPSSPYSGVISIFSERIMRGERITIYGDGEQARDFIYVLDVVNFLVTAMDNVGSTAQVFNVCTGKATTIKQLTRILMSIRGERVPVERQATRKGDIRVSIGDPSYGMQQLGLKIEYALLDGLRELVKYDGVVEPLEELGLGCLA